MYNITAPFCCTVEEDEKRGDEDENCKGLCVIVQTDHNSCDRVLFSWSFLRAKKGGRRRSCLLG
jgi:hypothetical protein